MNTSPRVALLGNISVGKSSVTRLVSYSSSECLPVFEPLEKCRASGLFDLFYNDRKTYGLQWQKMVVGTRQGDVKTATDNKTPTQMLLIDGHMLTDRHVFVENLFDENSLTLAEKAQYENYYNQMVPAYENEVYIYLRCDPSVSLARARIRARDQECGLTLEYLKGLHEKLESFVTRPEIRERLFIVDVSRPSLGTIASTVGDIVKEIYKSQGMPKNVFRVYEPVLISCDEPATRSSSEELIVK